MTGTQVFRPVRPDDVDALVEIALLAWEPIYALRRERLGDALFERVFSGWRDLKAAEVRSAAADIPARVWVTELDGRPVAFTSFRVDRERGVGELLNNAVVPGCQGQGIGSQQHAAVLRMFREQGLDHALVSTGLDPAHAPARASYEKMGFRPMTESVTYLLPL